jgi:dihydroorotate dehydrogenase (fumarate)
MHSLFEEQIGEPAPGQMALLERAASELTAGFAHFPRPDAVPRDPHGYLEQIRRIKTAVSIPVIASLNATGPNGWLDLAPLVEQAGADALELNVYYLSTDFDDMPDRVEQRIESTVRELKGALTIPLGVKLTPFYTAFANLARRLDRAGADGLVLFNRFYHSDVDVDTLDVLPNLRLSTSADLLLRLHWTAVLSQHVRASLAVTGGVHTALDGIKAILSGAHAVQMVSAVLQQGPVHFRTMADGLKYWMSRHQFASLDACRGRANLSYRTNPADFERAGYRKVLETWNA